MKEKTAKTLMGTGQDKAFVESMWGMKEHFQTDKLIKAMSCKNKIVTLAALQVSILDIDVKI